MKTSSLFLRCFVLLITFLMLACSSHRIKGTASDRSGTNGATNGTGKIARGL